MAKKIILPESLKGDIISNLEQAEKQTSVPSGNIPLATEPATTLNRRVGERSADRGPMMNVHVTMETKEQLERVKAARRRRGIKVTTDTLIYEAVVSWLENNFNKELNI